MSRESRRRRLALLVVYLAQQVMPASRQGWAEAMQNEIQHLEGDAQALRWACGCLFAACSTRLAQWPIFDFILVRLAVVMLVAFKVFDDLFATAMTISYRISALGVTESFGQATAGDDYARFIPLMEAIPAWLHGMWVGAGLLLVLAVVLYFRRARTAYILVILAVGLEQAAQMLGRPIIAANAGAVNANPSLLVTAIIPFLLPLMIALPMWLSGRRNSRPDSRTGQRNPA